MLKHWSIDEFLNECQKLKDNPYTYKSENMPDGICNGHKVGIYEGSWSSIVIDGGIENLSYSGVQDGRNSSKTCGQRFSMLEWVRLRLTE